MFQVVMRRYFFPSARSDPPRTDFRQQSSLCLDIAGSIQRQRSVSSACLPFFTIFLLKLVHCGFAARRVLRQRLILMIGLWRLRIRKCNAAAGTSCPGLGGCEEGSQSIGELGGVQQKAGMLCADLYQIQPCSLPCHHGCVLFCCNLLFARGREGWLTGVGARTGCRHGARGGVHLPYD